MAEKFDRVTVSIAPELLATFDEVCAAKGYASRSEAMRDAIRNYLVSHRWEAPGEDDEVFGTITLVYEPGDGRTLAELLAAKNDSQAAVRGSLLVPLDATNSLEVIVVGGAFAAVSDLADKLISTRGVKHGRLCTTAAG